MNFKMFPLIFLLHCTRFLKIVRKAEKTNFSHVPWKVAGVVEKHQLWLRVGEAGVGSHGNNDYLELIFSLKKINLSLPNP